MNKDAIDRFINKWMVLLIHENLSISEAIHVARRIGFVLDAHIFYRSKMETGKDEITNEPDNFGSDERQRVRFEFEKIIKASFGTEAQDL